MLNNEFPDLYDEKIERTRPTRQKDNLKDVLKDKKMYS